MYNAIEARHNCLFPATYDRGRECLDWIAISGSINVTAIKRSRYLPFYEGYVSDHRGVHIDIDASALFTYAHPNANISTYKRFTTEKVKKCKKYIKSLEKQVKDAKICVKVKQLKKEMNHYYLHQEGNINGMIN